MVGDSIFKLQSGMNAAKEWISSQLIPKSFLCSRELSANDSLFDDGPLNEELDDRGSTPTVSLLTSSRRADASHSSSSNPENELSPTPQPSPGEDFHLLHQNSDRKRLDPLAKIEALQIKFFRLLQRLEHSPDNLMITQVLYRLHVATLIRAGELDLKRATLNSDRARVLAAKQEAAGQPELDFSVRILVLGKTGVGKSATINSVFDQTKATTDAFQPATDCVEEVVGTVKGAKITFIDTPGLLPSSTGNLRRNRKIMLSVKRFIRRSPPDIVLYFERLDLINMGYSDFPLLKLITDIFGSAIWFNTILVMTHSSLSLPEGSDGYPVNYESFVNQCTNLIRHYIHQAISDSRLDNPVLFVENHQQCKRNISGERILSDGKAWRFQFLLLCICSKVLGDANKLLKFQDSIEMGPAIRTQLPSLPHLLSSMLQTHSVSRIGKDDQMDEISDEEDEDEYDQLPPIRILNKSQFERLTKSQKEDYLDELEYRETLYLKKQWKAETRRQRDNMLTKGENDDNFDNQDNLSEAIQLPDMTVPSTFDSDCPVHRYRCLVTSDQWLVRPVLDPDGWDHDVGFDGINVETAVQPKRNLHASVMGQMSKDKQDFSAQTECCITYNDPKWPILCAGVNGQSTSKGLVCTIHGDTKFRNLKNNMTGCGLSVTSFGKTYYVGAKLEDTISMGKRVKLVLNAGRMGSPSQVAYGGSFGMTFRGRDYPVRNDKASFNMTVLSLEKDMVIGGSIQSDFRAGRGTRVSINANLNSQRMGQVCIKTSSSEHVEIALFALVSLVQTLLRKVTADSNGT